ncbi:MAG: transposase [Thermoguttaceae bacterium]
MADGFYAKRPFLKPVLKLGVVMISRLRKDACLYSLPPKPKKGRRGRGRPKKYGKKHLSLAKRAAAKRGWRTMECIQYGKTVKKKYKTFLATYRGATA